MPTDTQFVKDCQNAAKGSVLNFPKLTFEELFNLKYPINDNLFLWQEFEIYAKTNKEFIMQERICVSGTKVRVWMVSRFEDIGITDNIINPIGYDIRGVQAEDLYDWEIIKKIQK